MRFQDPGRDTWLDSAPSQDFLDGIKKNYPGCPEIYDIFKSSTRLIHFGLYTTPPIPNWNKGVNLLDLAMIDILGNVIIIGDAAHPTLPTFGQGANMSIEVSYGPQLQKILFMKLNYFFGVEFNFFEQDAVFLARQLDKPYNKISEVLEAVNAERQPKTAELVKASKMFSQIENASGWKGTFRNLFLEGMITS